MTRTIVNSLRDTQAHFGVHLRLLGMAALWGGSWPAGRVLAGALPPVSAALWRFAIALAAFTLWLFASDKSTHLRAVSRRQWTALALAGAMGVFAYSICFMVGLAHVPAGRAALVITANPVFTALIAAWLFGERLNARIAVGMVLAVLGSCIVMTHGAPWKIFTGEVGLGEALLMGCVASWVGYTLVGRHVLSGVDPLVTTVVTTAFGVLLLLASASGIEGASGLLSPMRMSSEAWMALLFLSFGATAVAYSWYFQGVAVLGAGAAAAYISLVPVFAVLFSAMWLGERVDGSILAGGAMAVGGMVAMHRARHRATARSALPRGHLA